MKINGWQYYNNAAIPTVAPHEEPDLRPIEDKSIWKLDGKTPLLARWTTEFDCGCETNWWYVIKDAPFDLENITSKERKSIRQALKKCYTKVINPSDYMEDLYECYSSAYLKYKNANIQATKESFVKSWENNHVECWGGFDKEDDKLIGYMTVCVHDTFVEIQTAKFNPIYLKRQVSDVLYHDVLYYYLNECHKKYVSSGSRSINHVTGTQEYKIRRFGYRKAYCKLHIEYNPNIRAFILVLYLFRKILLKFDNIHIVHQINAVLTMEEISRREKTL